jgi:hypothetical protein
VGGTAPDCTTLDDECEIGLCSEETGGCLTEPSNEGGACEDGNACTLDDTCALGACIRISFCGVPISRAEKPTSTDALYTLRTAVGLEECDVCECDVNADGNTTVSDALTILAASVDLEAKLDCFSPAAASVQ